MKRLNLKTKIADEPWELEEVSRLNHQTFSDEIHQHENTASGLLIDKFHSENQYILCLDKSEIVGMIALRDVRPFSLDFKLENIDEYLPPFESLCEIRLLTVKPQYRGTKVFYYLFKEVFTQFIKKKYDYALISGILSQQKLYRSIGFVPFGPLVGDIVKFQPMYCSPDFFFKSKHNTTATNFNNKRINALPGPVDIKEIITEEFKNIPESHRSELFCENFERIRASLCNFVNSKNAQIFTGSGTLANEVMLAHISTLSIKGLILSNGEFGNRIIHQANCHKLNFIEYNVPYGNEFDSDQIALLFQNNVDIKWLFLVHCETSTGILNNLVEIIKITYQRNILVFFDCVSTFGIIPLDLSKVYMASASSGKAIGTYSGLSIVFFNDLLNENTNQIPVYLDLRHYINRSGIPFTLNSNALYALGIAMGIADVNTKYNKIKEYSIWLRNKISDLGLKIEQIDNKELHPAITTIKLPESVNSSIFGKLLEEKNILINYNSDYLLSKNMIQICLFSDISVGDLKYLMNVLESIIKPSMLC